LYEHEVVIVCVMSDTSRLCDASWRLWLTLMFFQWKTIIREMLSRGRHHEATQSATSAGTEVKLRCNRQRDGPTGGRRHCRNGGSPMLLALQTPMYPPGNIIHVVRNYPKHSRSVCFAVID